MYPQSTVSIYKYFESILQPYVAIKRNSLIISLKTSDKKDRILNNKLQFLICKGSGRQFKIFNIPALSLCHRTYKFFFDNSLMKFSLEKFFLLSLDLYNRIAIKTEYRKECT